MATLRTKTRSLAIVGRQAVSYTTKAVATDKLEGLKFMCLAKATKTRAVDKLEGAPSSLLATAELLLS